MHSGSNYMVFQREGVQTGKTVFGLALFFLSIFLLFLGLFEEQPLYIGIGALGSLVFAGVSFFNIRRFIARKVLVMLTPEGFYDYSSVTSPKGLLIPWENVGLIKQISINKQRFITVYLKAPELYYRNLTAAGVKAARNSAKMGHGQINITLDAAKNESVTNLAVEMRRYLLASQQEQSTTYIVRGNERNETIFD